MGRLSDGTFIQFLYHIQLDILKYQFYKNTEMLLDYNFIFTNFPEIYIKEI